MREQKKVITEIDRFVASALRYFKAKRNLTVDQMSEICGVKKRQMQYALSGEGAGKGAIEKAANSFGMTTDELLFIGRQIESGIEEPQVRGEMKTPISESTCPHEGALYEWLEESIAKEGKDRVTAKVAIRLPEFAAWLSGDKKKLPAGATEQNTHESPHQGKKAG